MPRLFQSRASLAACVALAGLAGPASALAQAPALPPPSNSPAMPRLPAPVAAPSTNEDVALWTSKAVADIMSFAWSNYEGHMRDVAGDFTEKGMIGYRKALEDSKSVDAIVSNKIVVTARVTGPATATVDPTSPAGAWTVKFPMSVEYTPASPDKTVPKKAIDVAATVVRVNNGTGTDGLRIAQVVATAH